MKLISQLISKVDKIFMETEINQLIERKSNLKVWYDLALLSEQWIIFSGIDSGELVF